MEKPKFDPVLKIFNFLLLSLGIIFLALNAVYKMVFAFEESDED